MKIGIFGAGILGRTHADWLLKNTSHEVLIYDIDASKANCTKESMIEFADCFVICLPTDTVPGEKFLSMAHVDNALNDISKGLPKEKEVTVFIRSTVSIGFSRKMNDVYKNLYIIFVPEFLTEKTAKEDFEKGTRIFGTMNEKKAVMEVLKSLDREVFPTGEDASILIFEEAELIKLATNSFYAMKVTFANELNEFCQKRKLDYSVIKKLLSENPRIGSNKEDNQGKDVHLRISQDGKAGFGGKCLTKDICELSFEYESEKVDMGLLQKVIEINSKIRK